MSNLSELIPAGSGAKVAEFVASGTLASGQTVALKADGTVAAVSATGTPLTFGLTGSATTVLDTPTNNSEPHIAYDPVTNQIVIFYLDTNNNDYTTAVVGSVDADNTFTFGTPIVVQSASNTGFALGPLVWNTTENAVVSSWTTSSGLNVVAGTLETKTISLGTIQTYTSGTPREVGLGWNENDNAILVPFKMNNANAYIRKYTMSGSTLTYSAQSNTNLNMEAEMFIVGYDSSSQKCVLAYTDNDQGNWLSANVIDTSSGLTVGSKLSISDTLSLGTAAPGFIASDTDQNILAITWVTPDGTNGRAKAAVLTVSGTTLSVGSATQINSSSNWSFQSGGYSPASSSFVWTGINRNSPNQLFIQGFTVSGTTVTKTADTTTGPNNVSPFQNVALNTSNNAQFFQVWSDSSTRDVFVQVLNTSSSITNSADFVGITNAAISNSATGEVAVQGGVSEKVTGLTIASDYYVQADGTLNTATSAVNYDIANASYTQAFSVSSQDIYPSAVAFNADGTKMFIAGNQGDDIGEYTLSTGFDVSTASFVDSFSVNSQESAPMGVAFNTDGTRMFVNGEAANTVFQYALSTGFDVSTASYTQGFSTAAQDSASNGVAFNTDGTKMFVTGESTKKINEYTLSSAFDVSTASYVDGFLVSSQADQPKDTQFNSDGTEMYLVSRSPATAVYKYTLTTGFDVSTASYASVSFSIANQETSPQGLAFSADGSKMYVCGFTGADVNEYATSTTVTNSTTVPAGRALSATSILLEG